ncbi:MAG: arylsulfatase, partial [Sodaliphilus sp.]|nr:arylsulfatase [Sodaliphilus sp.]
YFSDHGEEIYDYRDQRGRHVSYAPSADMLRHQNEVPFVIWCSDRYKQLHPEIVNDIRAAVNRKFMTDNVGQTLLRLGRISTEYYRAERDVTSPRFTTRPRILYDHVDYDAVMAASKRR